MKHAKSIRLLKNVYFLSYPFLVYLFIPYLLYLVYGDGALYRAQMTTINMALIAALNGP